MKTRIRSKWRRDRDKPVALEDNAVALAYIIWQIALSAAKNLHAHDFVYESDKQRIGVIIEYLSFMVHVVDRCVHEEMEDPTRERFITTLARGVARHLQHNQADIMGPDDYRSTFFDLLNERMGEYAETSFPDNRPGFELLRCFGEKILAVMGSHQVNRWVIDHIIQIDAPEAVDHLKQAYNNLFGSVAAASSVPFDQK